MDDELIIKYLRRGKEKGLDMLLKKYGGLITSIVKKQLNPLGNYEEECIDDILLAIWDNIQNFDNTGSFKSWIGAICKYKTIDYKRKYLIHNQTENIDELAISDMSHSVENIVLKEELKNEIMDIINSLNAKDREIFIRYYLDNEKTDVISLDLNLSLPQIHNRLSRGRKTLRTLFNAKNL